MIIKCSECGHSVSDKAAACPNCGAPIASAKVVSSIGEPLATTQATSKRLKLQSLIWGGMLLATLATVVIQASNEDYQSTGFLGFIIIISIIGYTVTKIRIWWHHS